MIEHKPPSAERIDFLELLTRSKRLLLEFDKRKMFVTAAAMSEAIDTLRKHPFADPLDFADLEEAALNCFEQPEKKD